MSKLKFPTEYIRTPQGRIAQSVVSIGERPGTEGMKARSSGILPKKGAGPGFVPKERK